MKRVIVESPFRGNSLEERQENIRYAQACCSHAAKLGFVPFASHLFFPQFLDEDKSDERQLGIEMGYDFWEKSDFIFFYTDRGFSPGMEKALAKAFMEGKQVRKLSIKNGVVDKPQEPVPDEVAKFAPKPRVDLSALEAEIADAKV